ncbi:putative basic proline-rich protein-like [Iris pallida]|uniref:Basic proline-rich protein-like n=1 Tax=Iris pallida TaxID=29817 RepID=A0AAX6EDK6_IRIPA|nr:putative basic proline-rich protein-like [Iris pallida]KAJ6846129.1 putative basic proline-rich protein-like [Iris pallida]
MNKILLIHGLSLKEKCIFIYILQNAKFFQIILDSHVFSK